MSDRSTFILIISPKNTIDITNFLLSNREYICEQYGINELIVDHPDVYENMINDNIDFITTKLIEGKTYSIAMMKNSAGWPESINVFEMDEHMTTSDILYSVQTYLEIPS